MDQSVKSRLQLFFAVFSLTALVFMTIGASPPLEQLSLHPKIFPVQTQCTDVNRDVSKVWSLTSVLEGHKYTTCELKEVRHDADEKKSSTR